MTQLPKYFLTKPINYNRKWYNINIEYSMYRKIISLKKFRLLFIILLTLCFMQEQTNDLPKNDDKYRLISINQARKILQIRHKTLTEIIKEGKIKIININGKIKIPRKNLDQYIDEESKSVTSGNKIENKRKAPQSAKFILDSIIKKHQ